MNTLRLSSIPPFRKVFILVVALVVTLILRQFDLFTGPELSFSIFYLVPIMGVTWLLGDKAGLLIAIASTISWFSADIAQHSYHLPLAPYWNALVRLILFVIITLLLAAVRHTLLHEQLRSRIDPLTGIANRRAFLDMLGIELRRAWRYRQPITLAYVDVDDFKLINDRYGHARGDRVLQLIAETIRDNLRAEDLVARLGGDEFALLLINTDRTIAQASLTRIRAALTDAMHDEGLVVGLSVGSVTSSDAVCTPKQLIAKADTLMYEVKREGKDAIRCEIVTCRPPE